MITLALYWGLWTAFVVGVMLVDRSLKRYDDFSAGPGAFFVLAAITPFLILPIYFYSSHRIASSARRWGLTLAGIPLTIFCSMLASFHLGLWAIAASRLLA